jgi:very-short-patch-repair endonuclease
MRKGSTRPLNLTKACECGVTFQCSDPKRRWCNKCNGCQCCGAYTRAESRMCAKCRGSHLTDKQMAQLKRLHASIIGINNPSKRLDVRKKISEGKMGDLNPARIHREQFAAHIAKYRPGKVSALENSIALYLPTFLRQHKVGWYSLDFADPMHKIAVEVQGCWHHSCPICFPNSPEHKTQRMSRGNDIRKAKYLLSHGWKLINIWEHDIRNKLLLIEFSQTCLPKPSSEKDIHTEHCCVLHGCAYCEDKWGCTVTTFKKPQSYLCSRCQDIGITLPIVRIMCSHDKYLF